MAILLDKLSIRLDRFPVTNGEFMDQSLFGIRSTILNYLKVCGPSDGIEWNVYAQFHGNKQRVYYFQEVNI
jgi:hypothetical protein